jgi:hypothetical protein
MTTEHEDNYNPGGISGQCPYCNLGLVFDDAGPGLEEQNYELVRKDNEIIKICGSCCQLMHQRDEFIEIVIIERYCSILSIS